MKKLLSILVLSILLLIPTIILAQTPMFSVPNPISYTSLPAVIKALIQIAFTAAGLVAVIYIIVGGFRYITSSGNPEGIEAAKATIFNSIIGLIIILISFLLVNYILEKLNVGPLYRLGVESTSPTTSPSVPSGGEGGELPTVTPTTPTPSTPTPTPTSQGSPPIYV